MGDVVLLVAGEEDDLLAGLGPGPTSARPNPSAARRTWRRCPWRGRSPPARPRRRRSSPRRSPAQPTARPMRGPTRSASQLRISRSFPALPCVPIPCRRRFWAAMLGAGRAWRQTFLHRSKIDTGKPAFADCPRARRRLRLERGERRRLGKITLKDIAIRASVSPSTVSLVLRNSPLVAPRTRDEVRAVMDELAYVYNRRAANLRTRRSRTIGILVPDTPTRSMPSSSPASIAFSTRPAGSPSSPTRRNWSRGRRGSSAGSASRTSTG